MTTIVNGYKKQVDTHMYLPVFLVNIYKFV
jgi:hypothetical protein